MPNKGLHLTVANAPASEPKRYLTIMRIGKIIFGVTTVACVAALAISIFPGWLNNLLFIAVLLGIFVVPITLIVLGILAFIHYRRGNIHIGRIPWKCVATTLGMLFFTYAALKFYIPRRIAFACYRSSFQQFVSNGVRGTHDFNNQIGPYHVDKCLVDDRGGIYFRIYSRADGIGPDTMSYGFCYNPNSDGSPFGAARYRTFRLGNGWYWFRASDDWF